MKRVAAVLYYDERENRIYVVPTEVHDNPWLPEIDLKDVRCVYGNLYQDSKTDK